MIHGIGCDILDVNRIKKLLSRYNDKFIHRILTKNELNAAMIKTSGEEAFSLFLAKRYAAKEAYVKAIGSGISEEIAFHDIEVSNDARGKPYFSKTLSSNLLGATHLSLSDEPPYVMSYVIIECSEKVILI